MVRGAGANDTTGIPTDIALVRPVATCLAVPPLRPRCFLRLMAGTHYPTMADKANVVGGVSG